MRLTKFTCQVNHSCSPPPRLNSEDLAHLTCPVLLGQLSFPFPNFLDCILVLHRFPVRSTWVVIPMDPISAHNLDEQERIAIAVRALDDMKNSGTQKVLGRSRTMGDNSKLSSGPIGCPTGGINIHTIIHGICLSGL